MMDKPTAMSFGMVIGDLDVTFQGDQQPLATALEKAVAECVKGAHRYTAPAMLKLEITFEVEDGRATILAQLDAKVPKPKGIPALAYVDRDGRLVAADPRQPSDASVYVPMASDASVYVPMRPSRGPDADLP